MDKTLLEWLAELLPMLVIVLSIGGALLGIHFWAKRREGKALDVEFKRQVATVFVIVLGAILVIAFSPMDPDRRSTLLNLIAVLFSAMIALSSPTILGNALSGFMLRAQRSFKPGDFIVIGEHFGRISEQSLFHVEIQDENRDYVTLPNTTLAQTPFKIIPGRATLVTVNVSLGYDVPRKKIEAALCRAAEEAELQDPFVRIMALGDFSVSYRVAGLLEDVKKLVSTRARLHSRVLDALHHDGIEIVSPNFMNQRVLPLDKEFIPAKESQYEYAPELSEQVQIEKIMFDKADQAESIEKLRQLHKSVEQKIKEEKQKLEESQIEEEKEAIKKRIEAFDRRHTWLAELIKKREQEAEKE